MCLLAWMFRSKIQSWPMRKIDTIINTKGFSFRTPTRAKCSGLLSNINQVAPPFSFLSLWLTYHKADVTGAATSLTFMFKSSLSPAGLWFSVLGFSLVTQHDAVLEGGDRADSTHWPSCKSLFYGPCNDPPAGNLHSVALQIEPAASGSRHGGGGALMIVAGGSGKLENTHCVTMYQPTHTH